MKRGSSIDVGLKHFSVTVEMHDDGSGTLWLYDFDQFVQSLIDFSCHPIILHNPTTAQDNTIYITQTRVDRSTGQAICLVDFSVYS